MRKSIPFAVALVTFVRITASLAGDECAQCEAKVSAQQKQVASQTEQKALLHKNMEYLAALSPDDSSKLIKLSSNITQLNVKLEAIDKNIAKLDREIAKTCGTCGGTRRAKTIE